MRYIILVLLLLLSINASEAKTSFGILGGLHSGGSTQDPDDGFEVKRTGGILLGGAIERPLNTQRSIFFRGELLYVQKGWKEEGDASTFYYEGTVRAPELVLAPFVDFRFKADGFTPFVELGLEFGHVLSTDAEIKILGVTASGSLDDYATSNTGFNFGFGTYVPAGQGDLQFGLRFNSGLKNMNDGNDDFEVRTNGVMLIVGYMFSTYEK